MHIAIVEDDPFQRQFLTMLVESGGHRAASFSQGRDFINALDTETFDLLLLDWMLPEMSGDQILAVLRQRNGLELPVIVVTARDSETDVVTALRQGADDYIVKPPKSLELLARMEALTRRARNARVGVLRAGCACAERVLRLASCCWARPSMCACAFQGKHVLRRCLPTHVALVGVS